MQSRWKREPKRMLKYSPAITQNLHNFPVQFVRVVLPQE